MNSDKQVIIAIIVIMLILILGGISLYAYQKIRYSDVFFKYGEFDIHKVKSGKIEQYEISFYKENSPQQYIINSRYNPKDLEEIKIYDNISKDLIKEKLYITMDPYLPPSAIIAFAEINKYMENPYLFNLPTYPGITRQTENSTLPVITCNNVTSSIGIVLFEIGEKNEIYSRKGCIVLEATTADNLIRLADRLSLTVLGIMKP